MTRLVESDVEHSARTHPDTSPHCNRARVLFLLAWLGVLVRIFSTPSMSHPDIWWHLANARQFLSTGHFATSDVYSFTANGSAWINHEWLSELLIYCSFASFGWRGLYCFVFILQTLFAFGVFWLAYRAGRNETAAFLYSGLAVVLGTVNFGPRTILFGWLFLIALLVLLDDFRARSSKRIWLVPLLFALWINAHGSWLIGAAIFSVIVLCHVVARSRGDDATMSALQMRQLAVVAGTSFVALLANPYGYRLVLYPFQFMIHQQTNLHNVLEWASVDFQSGRGKVVFLLLALTFVLFAVTRVRVTAEEVVLVLIALYLGLSHVRFVMLTSILLASVLSVRIASLLPRSVPILSSRAYAAFAVGLSVLIVLSFPSSTAINSASEAENPRSAIVYLQAKGDQARVFNYWEWGGFEIWCNGPAPFIDTRTDIFEYNGTLQDYLDTIRINRSLEVLDKYKIDYVLFPHNARLSYLLQHTPGWRVVYSDANSMIFGRI